MKHSDALRVCITANMHVESRKHDPYELLVDMSDSEHFAELYEQFVRDLYWLRNLLTGAIVIRVENAPEEFKAVFDAYHETVTLSCAKPPYITW
jgi:hypothetical protein